mgnify:CR=1 FL=1
MKVKILKELKMSKNKKFFIDILKTCISLIVTAYLAYVSYEYGIYAIEKNLTITPINISKLFSILPLIIGFALMFLHELYRIIFLITKKEPFGFESDTVTEKVKLEAGGEN